MRKAPERSWADVPSPGQSEASAEGIAKRSAPVSAKKKNIHLFDDHAVTELPTNFYVGKNRVVYAIYQPYDIAPYSEGVVSVAIGKI